MKWIFALLLFISAAAIGQVDDTTKYINYPTQYGYKIPRMWAPTTMIMPSGDTTGRRPGKIGAFMTCLCDGNVYRWNGSNWVAFGGATSAPTWEQVLNNGDTLLTDHRVIAQDKSFTFDSVGSFLARTSAYQGGVAKWRGLYSRLELLPMEINLFAENGGVRSYGFQANDALTQMFATGHVSGHAGFVQADTAMIILESDPNRFYVMHDSVALTNINNGTLDFRIRTLPPTIDTAYKSLVSGPNGQVYLRPGANGTSAITQLTGDVTAGPGSGSQAATLATVNSNVGSFTNANITVNGKGLITAASNGSGGGGLNMYNTDSTLSANRIITQSGRYFRLQNGIPYTEFLGGKTTILPDSGSIPYYIREIKSPFSGPTASGIISWHEGIGSADQSPQRPNYPYIRGWNLAAGGGAFVSGLPAIGESWEPHYLPDPGSPNLWFQEIHKYFIQTNGTQRRLESWTINTRDNDWSVYYTTPSWSVRDTNAVDYISASRNGGLNVHNTTAGTTNFSISNGIDVSLFSLAPGTNILDYTGQKLRVNGSINFSLKNGTSSERELIAFEGDGGTTGYIGKYNSAWASQTHLQNGMVILAANGTPTETMLLLKPGGTAWLGDLDSYNSGSHKVNISGSLALRGIGTTTTAPEVLVRLADSSARGMTMANLANQLGAGSTIDAINTTAQNTGTSETDLFSKTIAANTLTADKQTLNFEADGEFNDNTATAQLKLYFGGNVTLNTGAISILTANTAWKVTGYIMRTSSTTAHVTYELQALGLATPVFLGYSNLTSLDFTTTNVFKITAQAGGAGGGTADITAHSWQVLYRPAP